MGEILREAMLSADVEQGFRGVPGRFSVASMQFETRLE